MKTQTVQAEPYTARRCPECGLWIYTAAGPFAEDNDRTKTMADALHWEAEHEQPGERHESASGALVIGFPFFNYNAEPVEAVYEQRFASVDCPECDRPVCRGVNANSGRASYECECGWSTWANNI